MVADNNKRQRRNGRRVADLSSVALAPGTQFTGIDAVFLWTCRFLLLIPALLFLWDSSVLDRTVSWTWHRLIENRIYQNQYFETFFPPFILYPFCLFYHYVMSWVLGDRYRIGNVPVSARTVRQVEGPGKILTGTLIYLGPYAVVEVLKTPRIDRLLSSPVPTFSQVFAENVATVVLFDFIYFCIHFALHRSSWLYRTIHKEHHRDKVTAPVDANWVHWAERGSLVFSAAGALKITKSHFLSRNTFTIYAVFFLVENHSGYDAPWMLSNVIPGRIIAGSRNHFMHHSKQEIFYAEYLTWADNTVNTMRGWSKKGAIADIFSKKNPTKFVRAMKEFVLW